MITLRKPRVVFANAAAFTIVSSLLFSACAGSPTCEDYGNCAEGGSSGGSSGNTRAGSTGKAGRGATNGSDDDDDGGTGGVAAGAGASGESGASGAAGSAGASPCSGACHGTTPVCDLVTETCVECLQRSDCQAPTPACDTAADTCVECTANTDCAGKANALCDKLAGQCVACLAQADCRSATASACKAGACAACTKDEECANVAGKGVCDAGTCVGCTVANEAVCGGTSCNPATKTCTTTATGSVTACKPCTADSECVGGNQTDADTRCVPMKFKGAARTGGFCLRRVTKSCASPYKVVTTVASLSGATSESYCGINEDLTRCEAVLDLLAGSACADGQDGSCGCARDVNGACVAPGQGGLCRTVGPDANHCSYECGTSPQCPAGTACAGSATTYCQ